MPFAHFVRSWCALCMIRQSLGLPTKVDSASSQSKSQTNQLASVKEEVPTRIEHAKEDVLAKSEYSRDALIELGRQQRQVSTEARTVERVEGTTSTDTMSMSQPAQMKSVDLDVPAKGGKTRVMNENDTLVRGKALSLLPLFSLRFSARASSIC